MQIRCIHKFHTTNNIARNNTNEVKPKHTSCGLQGIQERYGSGQMSLNESLQLMFYGISDDTQPLCTACPSQLV